MDIYSVKQPQNILSNHKILKIKMKEHEIGKKNNTGKKLNEVYIVLILSVRHTCSALFTSGKAVQLE